MEYAQLLMEYVFSMFDKSPVLKRMYVETDAVKKTLLRHWPLPRGVGDAREIEQLRQIIFVELTEPALVEDYSIHYMLRISEIQFSLGLLPESVVTINRVARTIKGYLYDMSDYLARAPTRVPLREVSAHDILEVLRINSSICSIEVDALKETEICGYPVCSKVYRTDMPWCPCGDAFYCNKDCQRLDWNSHKMRCSCVGFRKAFVRKIRSRWLDLVLAALVSQRTAAFQKSIQCARELEMVE
jgi:hypothetical protein